MTHTVNGRQIIIWFKTKKIVFYPKSKVVRLFVLVCFLLLVVSCASLVKKAIDHRQVKIDCASIAQRGKQLVVDKNYKAGYDELKLVYDKCGNTKKEEKEQPNNVSSVQYLASLAELAYLADDKDSAKRYAKESLVRNKNLSDEERKNMPDQAKEFYKMLDIEDGIYQPESVKAQ